MIKLIKKYLLKKKRRKEKLLILSEKRKELDKLQSDLDHEGKMRALCDYDEEEMNKFFYPKLRKVENKESEINDFIRKNNLN